MNLGRFKKIKEEKRELKKCPPKEKTLSSFGIGGLWKKKFLRAKKGQIWKF